MFSSHTYALHVGSFQGILVPGSGGGGRRCGSLSGCLGLGGPQVLSMARRMQDIGHMLSSRLLMTLSDYWIGRKLCSLHGRGSLSFWKGGP